MFRPHLSSRRKQAETSIAFRKEEKASRALSFAIEDTQERCYRDLVEVLSNKGWTKIPFRKRSKLEKKRYVYICE